MFQQIQIIATAEGLQDIINNAVQTAFDKLQTNGEQTRTKESPISVKELCVFLGVTEPTIIRWRRKGKIPFMQIGKRVLYDKNKVVEALEKKK